MISWSKSVAASTSNMFFTHLKGCCHGICWICWFTPLDIDISSHRHSKTSWKHGNGSSARESRWAGARKVVDIWSKHGKVMKIIWRTMVRIHPISRVIYSYLNDMGIQLEFIWEFIWERPASFRMNWQQRRLKRHHGTGKASDAGAGSVAWTCPVGWWVRGSLLFSILYIVFVIQITYM